MIANAPISDNGTDRLGMMVARDVAQEEKYDQHDQADRQRKFKFDVFDRSADGDSYGRSTA